MQSVNLLHKWLPALSAALLLVCSGTVSLGASAQAATASIEMRTGKAFVFSTGDQGLQPVQVIISNPTSAPLRDIEFSITFSAGTVIGDIDQECDYEDINSFARLTCAYVQIDAFRTHVMDFFIDGPLSTPDNGIIELQLIADSSLTVIEQSDAAASLADNDRSVAGSSLTLQLVRDILYDGNNNTIPDINEQILQPDPNASWESINATLAVLDVLFLATPTAESYLDSQLPSRIDQLLTGTNEVFRENNIGILTRSVGVEQVDYTTTEPLQTTLQTISDGSNVAFSNVPTLVQSSGADLVVLLHALPTGTDTFCAWSSNVAVGRQGDFREELHQGRLITVLDVGPNCIDIADLATSFATNMGIVPSRTDNPDGGTFSYSSGYAVDSLFRTIATRTSSQDFSNTPDTNRFSDPDSLCAGLPCGVDGDNIALGANAALSLRQTRHVVDALNQSGLPIQSDLFEDRFTPTFSNAIDLSVTHDAVESGALVGAFAEYEVTISNSFSEAVYDINVSPLHLNNGFYDLSARNYRVTDPRCHISGETVTTSATVIGAFLQKSGRLNCYIDRLESGQSTTFNYFMQIDAVAPELDEGENYYHEIIAINSIPQDESRVCLPVYTDLLDATVGSTVCNIVDQLQVATDTGTGFLDLEALPTVDGNFLNVPFIRLNDNSLISAQFQIINFGQPELTLVDFQTIDADLTPATESRFDEFTGHLSIFALSLSEASYNVEVDLNPGSDPPRFENMLLIEVEIEDTGDDTPVDDPVDDPTADPDV